MALIPQERPKQIALMVIILAAAGLYVLHTYWYTPTVVEIEELEARLSQLETQNRQAQVVAARGGAELEERLAVYERHVDRLEELIPEREEVPTLLNSMAMQAREFGVDLSAMRPEPPQVGEFYTLQSYLVEVVGDFHDVGQFLSSIASLPRIITPVDMNLEVFSGSAARQEMVAPVRAEFRIQTYVVPGRGDPTDGVASLGDEA
ncbi:MAG: type 4a pilus biogenesis protein PilO [Gemmatimonadota bacterium]